MNARRYALAAALFAAGCRAEGGAAGPARTAPATPATTPAPVAAVASVEVQPAALAMIAGDLTFLSATARDAAGSAVPSAAVSWTSDDPRAAAVVPAGPLAGEVKAVSLGRTSIRAESGGVRSAPVDVRVSAAPGPNVEPTDPYMATPAASALLEVPLVIVRFLPTRDGATLDAVAAGVGGALVDVRARLEEFDRRVKFALEEGSRFRGYKDAAALPSIGYRTIETITFYEEIRRGEAVPGDPTKSFPDFHDILGRIGGQRLVEAEGAREFWIWGYHHGAIVPPESNMSSPVTGDISNSTRSSTDLPVYRNGYTVYTYNLARSQSEAIHNHGHQLEAILSHRDAPLFWQSFVGKDIFGRHMTGRCGWTHMPPNTTADYDYLNSAPVMSDIEDWMPFGGPQKAVSAATWASLPYAWPGASSFAQKDEAQWYVYWMQSMPGRGNVIFYGSRRLSNWWQFTGDWDAAVRAGRRLTE